MSWRRRRAAGLRASGTRNRPSHPARRREAAGQDLITKFGGFTEVIAAEPARLAEVKGVGPALISQFKIVQEAAKRLARGKVLNRPVLGSWDALIDYCSIAMAHNPIEQVRVLYLDKKNVLIADEMQQKGTIDHTPVYPREVVKRALELGATAMILVHNHPSGNPQPSKADIDMTRQIVTAAEASRHRGPRPRGDRQGPIREFQVAGAAVSPAPGRHCEEAEGRRGNPACLVRHGAPRLAMTLGKANPHFPHPSQVLKRARRKATPFPVMHRSAQFDDPPLFPPRNGRHLGAGDQVPHLVRDRGPCGDALAELGRDPEGSGEGRSGRRAARHLRRRADRRDRSARPSTTSSPS